MAIAAIDQSLVKYQGHIVLKCHARGDDLRALRFADHLPWQTVCLPQPKRAARGCRKDSRLSLSPTATHGAAPKL